LKDGFQRRERKDAEAERRKIAAKRALGLRATKDLSRSGITKKKY
jgi:hypothetical protein